MSNKDHGSKFGNEVNACLVCALNGAVGGADPELCNKLIRALRPESSTEFMMPTSDTSSFIIPFLNDPVMSFLLTVGVGSLTILVNNRVYYRFNVDVNGTEIALNLLNWNHWVQWIGSVQADAMSLELCDRLDVEESDAASLASLELAKALQLCDRLDAEDSDAASLASLELAQALQLCDRLDAEESEAASLELAKALQLRDRLDAEESKVASLASLELAKSSFNLIREMRS